MPRHIEYVTTVAVIKFIFRILNNRKYTEKNNKEQATPTTMNLKNLDAIASDGWASMTKPLPSLCSFTAWELR